MIMCKCHKYNKLQNFQLKEILEINFSIDNRRSKTILCIYFFHVFKLSEIQLEHRFD
jgi:hypothetical protein